METSTAPVTGGRRIAGLDVVGLVRAARRRADTSQREMAEKAGLAASTVGRIEAGSLHPSLAVLEAVLAAAGIRLVAVGPDGKAVPPMLDAPDHNLRDGAGRRYPSHLDVIIDPTGWDWWGGRYGLARPPETFLRDRERRDVQRRRSRWEVRVALLYGIPPPMTVEQWVRAQKARRGRRRAAPVIDRTGGGSRAGPVGAGTFAP
ncbi:helix-turn-helix domain-containing protein [Pseudonocardia endophytica]|uniref:Helix-turn-helix protein n=1 Tax=Pseudonocardia endophytica TaxID=401976 RepID=A0A4R1I215_PSEEN|nr:helix-turn-helix transcriptional regulator [Pseudonocardia endophytica]TCK26519.1 helix-turn-helix protein [Pseudonocardia endophytica]